VAPPLDVAVRTESVSARTDAPSLDTFSTMARLKTSLTVVI
jgi:hypothetical protein